MPGQFASGERLIDMMIPKIEKKIEKFVSSEAGLISKKKLLTTGMAVAAASVMLKENFVYAKSVHQNSVFYQKDIDPATVIGGDTSAVLCTTEAKSAHINCDDHDNWGDGHASCSSATTNLDVVKRCYFHNDNFNPTVASDGVSVKSEHAHSYMAGSDKVVQKTFGADYVARDPWK